MSLNVYLAWYRSGSSSGQRHWLLFLSPYTDLEDFGRIYQIVEDRHGAPGRYTTELINPVTLRKLSRVDRFESRLLLGTLPHTKEVLDWIEVASDLVLDQVHQANARQLGSANSRSWCFEMISLMERNRFFPKGTMNTVLESLRI